MQPRNPGGQTPQASPRPLCRPRAQPRNAMEYGYVAKADPALGAFQAVCVELSYRVLAVNRAGQRNPSNSVTAVR